VERIVRPPQQGVMMLARWHATYFHGVRSKPRMRYLLLAAQLCICSSGLAQRQLYALKKSDVSFVSDAPMERIAAGCRSASGILDIKDRDFVVRIPMRSFNGFNSPLQQEHFHENYVESKVWPNALFEGRIIEAMDLSVPGTYNVRAKGRFTLHGVVRERLIPCQVIVSREGIRVTGRFDVLLADHAIRIPRVVQQKLAATVNVKVDLLFEPAPGK
jgi:hypothetical protein